MIISFVAAMGRNRVIGSHNALPWDLPADMKHFRDITKGKPVIMGRKTFESIGHALPGRVNVVMTRDQFFDAPGCVVVSSRDKALGAVGDVPEVMVIGGEAIYKEFLLIAGRIYLTIIDAELQGDAFFPKIDSAQWIETSREAHQFDEENPYAYTFVTLEKK